MYSSFRLIGCDYTQLDLCNLTSHCNPSYQVPPHILMYATSHSVIQQPPRIRMPPFSCRSHSVSDYRDVCLLMFGGACPTLLCHVADPICAIRNFTCMVYAVRNYDKSIYLIHSIERGGYARPHVPLELGYIL